MSTFVASLRPPVHRLGQVFTRPILGELHHQYCGTWYSVEMGDAPGVQTQWSLSRFESVADLTMGSAIGKV